MRVINALLVLFFAFYVLQIVSCDTKKEEPTIVKHEYIVSFQSFLPLDDHRKYIEDIIGESTSWEIVPRYNQATQFPSDFAVIRITAPFMDSHILSQLKKNQRIKRVYPQKRYTRSPNAFVDHEIVIDHPMGTPSHPFGFNTNNTCEGSSKYTRTGRETGKIFTQDEFGNFSSRKLHSTPQVTHLLNADFFWDKGITGSGVRVAIFDTGLSYEHPHFRNIKELTDWTDEGTLEDYVGHGTFVAGVIASVDPLCTGFAPDSDLYIFRVFTNSQASYTSWFLDAFNYAIHLKVNVLNLSIGGPDWMDEPFVEKVWELSANNVIVVSAIGNDGPLYGTLNNPADMMDVIGVGGIDYNDQIASFSSRGMTTWELPNGYGRVKPDIVGYGKSVSGSRFYEGCRTMSGTSVASPVIAGAVTLLVSSVPPAYRHDIVNPASMKQILVETSELVNSAGIFEQGFGKINMVAAYEALALYQPRASVIPSSLDLTECPYMWPFCAQPVYYTAMPIVFNTTILNGMGVAGMVDAPRWVAGENGDILELGFTYSDIIWPWSGFLAVHIQVTEEGESFRGTAEGIVQLTVRSPPHIGETSERISHLEIPVRVKVIPTPPRSKRLLWDQFHSISYPVGFYPNDVLWDTSDPFDWNADHLHTNFRSLFEDILDLGFFIEILGDPLTCFDASHYGSLLIVDPEEEFAMEEREKLYDDIANGLSLLVIADWYNNDIIEKISFFDENTEKTWTPYTGGANLPALNELLQPYQIAMGTGVYEGEVKLKGTSLRYGSGTSLIQFPPGGEVIIARLNDQGRRILTSSHDFVDAAILGLYSTENNITPQGGRIAVFGDSSCFDDAMNGPGCRWIIRDLLFYTNTLANGVLSKHTTLVTSSESPEDSLLPKRRIPLDSNEYYTRLPDGELECTKHSFEEPSNIHGDPVEVLWQPLMYIQKENELGELPAVPVTQMLQDNIEDYLVPYIIICGVVIIFMAFAIRRKKTTRASLPIDSNKALV